MTDVASVDLCSICGCEVDAYGCLGLLADDTTGKHGAYARAQRVSLIDRLETHRKRDELVVAALKLELERGCATGGGVGLAARVLAIYEEVPL